MPFVAPLGPQQLRLPRSFTVFGQKFILDSWAFSQVVFDEILWNESEVLRRVPSCLDIAFSVLANNHVVPELVERINNTSAVTNTNHSVRWRDGKPYQHNLAAVRNVIDAQADSIWEEKHLHALARRLAPTLWRDHRRDVPASHANPRVGDEDP
jgi:hypothetical protein